MKASRSSRSAEAPAAFGGRMGVAMAGEKKVLGVDEALERILASVSAPTESESLLLAEALGRTLAADVVARRTQPPVDVSAMDGYAVRATDLAKPDARLRIVGESAAGKGYDATLGAGETVRIFCDPKSLIYLDGTTLDFVTSMMGHGFKFVNPNVKGACGCGESVQF